MDISSIAPATTIIVIDWIIRIYLIFHVPRGRKPTAATAWLLAIFLLPGIIGWLLYVIIGSTTLSKQRRARQITINSLVADAAKQHIKHTLPDSIRSFTTLNQNLSQFPVTGGNAMTVITDYGAIISRIVDDIDQSRYYVYIESYITALDHGTEPLFQALERAVGRGVKVYVLFDAIGSRKFSSYKLMRDRLSDHGIKWRTMLPLSLIPHRYNRPDLRNHRKLIAIDNRAAYIGSLNLIEPRYERKDDIIYEELTARLEGPIVIHTAGIIAGDWYSETGDSIRHFNTIPQIKPTGSLIMQMLPSGPTYKNENNLKLFIDLIYAAKKTIVITNPYLVPTEPLLMALITAAQRGVSVTIINSEAVDQWMVAHAQRSYYQELLSAGVNIYLHKSPVLLHSKHITIDDDIAVIGSSNMDVRSFELNFECSLVIYDKTAVKMLEKMHRTNLAHSSKLTIAVWQHRRVWDSFLDSVARLTSALQ